MWRRGLVLGWLIGFAEPGAAATFLYFDSQPGDYIGQGLERTWTPAEGTFAASTNYDGGVSVYFDGGSGAWWHLDFAPPQGGEQLGVGVYEGAERFPFQSPTSPGLSVSGSGRGCNTLTGRFEVLELEITPGGDVVRLAVDFEQHCEGGTPALFGSLRFNSNSIPGILDADSDGFIDFVDNCPADPNADQANEDGDEFGDVCDPFPDAADNLGACLASLDADGDGEANPTDACPQTADGAAVDPSGCSREEFCGGLPVSTREGRIACRRADWRNDEPAVLHPRDCFVYRGGGLVRCLETPN